MRQAVPEQRTEGLRVPRRSWERWWVTGLVALCACNTSEAPAAVSVRVASQTIDSDAVLWALGEPTRKSVVAVSALVDDPRYSPIVDTWPPEIPRVKGTSEALIALRPSVVFLAEWSDPNARAMLTRAQAQVVVLDGYGGFADYRARVQTIGKAVEAEDPAEQLVAAFDERLAAISIPAHGTTIVSYSSGNTAGQGTTFDDMATAAGFVNLPAREGIEGHKAVGVEQILAWQPAYIVVPCEGDCTQTERDVAASPGVRHTPAARNAHVIAVPSPLMYATGARMLDVVQLLVERGPEADGA